MSGDEKLLVTVCWHTLCKNAARGLKSAQASLHAKLCNLLCKLSKKGKNDQICHL